jgi:hypothetical protein
MPLRPGESLPLFLRKRTGICKWLFPLFLACILSCAGEEREIGVVLDRRARALAEKDIVLYMSCVSSDYRDGGHDFEYVRKNVSGYFSSLDGVDVRFSGRKIYLEGSEATVYQDVTMRIVTGKGGHKVQRGRERLFMRHERDGWKIRGGLYGN